MCGSRCTQTGNLSFCRKAVFTEEDFKNGVCEIPYQIDQAHLHHGKNLGAVCITSLRQSICVPVEVLAGEELKDRPGIWQA